MLPCLPFPETQATLALAIVLFSFAYEDGATLLAAALTTAGRLDARLGLVSVFLGIWIGDLGLYSAGSFFGRRLVRSRWASRFVSTEKLDKAESWFAQRGPATLVMSRFIPGSRLPLYLAAGALRLPVKMFTIVTGICSAVWVTVIFLIWQFLPKQSLGAGRSTAWLLGAALLFGPWLLSKAASRVWHRARFLCRKYSRWEFWPAALFYPPVAAMCVWLGLRYRGFALPTIANPSFRNGGIVGESKIEVLTALMASSPDLVADAYLIPAGDLTEREQVLQRLFHDHSFVYPCVLKPNLGQRGDGFKLICNQAEARQYLASVPSDIVLQRYVGDQKEVGIFYYRFPGQERGAIFAVTEKIFPVLVGDGERTFEELLSADERASLIEPTYTARFPELSGRVLPPGERVRLVEAGNHCQGCIFHDGGHLLSEALRERIDRISQGLPGFFIGRYDIRYANDEDLRRGENFRIIELNGAASEATNIYDERNSLFSAYRTLYRQWKLVYAIGRANRDLGHKAASAFDVFRDWQMYRTISAAYPAAD